MNRKTNLLEFVELPVGLVCRLVLSCLQGTDEPLSLYCRSSMAHLGKNILESQVYLLFTQLVAIILEPLDKLLDRAVGLEGEEREAERDVAPLPRVLGETEPLAEFLDNVLGLLLLLVKTTLARAQHQ